MLVVACMELSVVCVCRHLARFVAWFLADMEVCWYMNQANDQKMIDGLYPYVY